MVNTGKPSSGCGTCRTRRIKCDERKPTCFRCQKSKRVCTGYRDPAFIRMSGLRRKRPQLQKEAAEAGDFAVQLFRDQSYAPYISAYPESGLRSAPVSPTYCLTTSIDDQAFCFFLKNFVLSPCKGNSRSYISFVVPAMMKEQTQTSKPSLLCTSVKAVSLALFGNRPNSRSLQSKAAKQYSKALKEVNHALANPKLALEDQTLAAVIMMGIFEAITATTGQPSGWLSHANGAALLVKARCQDENLSDLGRVLHIMVRSQVVINCFLSCTSPPLGVDWWMQFGTKDGLPSTCARLSLETFDLHSKINRKILEGKQQTSDIEKVMELLKSAKELESKFREWEATLPDMWRPSPVAWIDDSEEISENAFALPGRIDKFVDISIATAINVVGAARLLLIGDIVQATAWLCPPYQDYKATPEYLSAVRTSRQLIENILASVPYFLGQLPTTEASSPGPEDLLGTSALALFLTWPLFMTKISDFATKDQRKWAAGRLRYIANEKGIGQALTFSSMKLLIPSMFISRDRVALDNDPEVARNICLEIALASCGTAPKYEMVSTLKGILGLEFMGGGDGPRDQKSPR